MKKLNQKYEDLQVKAAQDDQRIVTCRNMSQYVTIELGFPGPGRIAISRRMWRCKQCSNSWCKSRCLAEDRLDRCYDASHDVSWAVGLSFSSRTQQFSLSEGSEHKNWRSVLNNNWKKSSDKPRLKQGEVTRYPYHPVPRCLFFSTEDSIQK